MRQRLRRPPPAAPTGVPTAWQVNRARSLAGATLAFAIVSCIGFVIPAYWFPGLGGLLGIIGTSLILCCASESLGCHIACATSCALAAALHAAGVGLYIWFYTAVVAAASDVDGPVVTAAYIGVLVWPAVILNAISLVLEVAQVVLCVKASAAILAGAIPTSADVTA